MLRRFLVLVFLAMATSAVAQNANSTPSKTTQKQGDAEIDYKQAGAPMPPLVFVPYYDSASKVKVKNRKEVMTGSDLDNGANIFVVMFNPTCGHCQSETILMGRNSDLFKKTKVVLLSNSVMKQYLPDFAATTHIEDHPFMYLGVDSMGFIGNTFLYQSLPQINIYSGERKLIKTYTGEVSIDTLKQYIQ